MIHRCKHAHTHTLTHTHIYMNNQNKSVDDCKCQLMDEMSFMYEGLVSVSVCCKRTKERVLVTV